MVPLKCPLHPLPDIPDLPGHPPRRVSTSLSVALRSGTGAVVDTTILSPTQTGGKRMRKTSKGHQASLVA